MELDLGNLRMLLFTACSLHGIWELVAVFCEEMIGVGFF